MYAIVKNGIYIALVDEPRYVRKNDNDIWVQTQLQDATALALSGILYNINGLETVEGAEQVEVVKMEKGEFFLEERNKSNITFVALAENTLLDDTTIMENSSAFAEWTYPISYKANAIRLYEGSLYRCLQAHDSQETWTPSAAPSLWVAIADPTEEYPQWSQPIGSTDAYMAGDKVSYNDRHYVSTIDNNVWAPDVYGWEEVE